ncbi:hypothetical protein BA898_03430 [Spiribacter roseus]|nr:hypothetical protein BBH56_01780 [Spiribacter roseus]KAF0283586.1 hypothetical protein BA898_03430 [Spiribacter roseus]
MLIMIGPGGHIDGERHPAAGDACNTDNRYATGPLMHQTTPGCRNAIAGMQLQEPMRAGPCAQRAEG